MNAELLLSYPKIATIGRRYAVTVDIQHDPSQWPFPDKEEHALHVVLDAEKDFVTWAEGDASLVVHRFGGTYGAARFTIEPKPTEEAALRLWVTLLDSRGALLYSKSHLIQIQAQP
jgi:hypothetical protein